MFCCFVCKDRSTTVSDLVKHLKKRHALYDGSTLSLKCFQENCVNVYTTFSGYRRHIRSCASNKESCSKSKLTNNDNYDFEVSVPPTLTNCEDLKTDSVSLQSHCSLYVSKLYSMGLPDSTIQTIVESTTDLLAVFSNSNVSVDEMCNIFSKFSSKYKREQYFKDNMVRPIEVPLGNRFDQVWDKNQHMYVQSSVSSTFTYVPILHTLQSLLKNPLFRTFFFPSIETVNSQAENFMVEFAHGTLFNESTFYQENVNAFQLQLYFDEFETVNPLGSKTGGHKVGAIYMVIRNLPWYLNSSLHNIHLVALFYSHDAKLFGLNSILDVIVRDIHFLEETGIYDDILECHLKGSLVALSHDNLGANQLYGLVESFSATYYCRICLATKANAQSLNTQDNTLLRTNDNYERHCSSIATSEGPVFGIKFRSSLNNLNFFKLCDNPSVDLTHDLLEGVVQLEIKLFLKFLISEKVISINVINERIKSFNYGFNERCNKPSPLCLDKQGNLIGQRAAQTACIIKYLPFILSDVLPSVISKYEKHYKVITLLLQIIRIVFCPMSSVSIAQRLSTKIEKHHKMYRECYGDKLTPKHHMMIHYGHVLLKMGSLVGLSTIRFEAKHGYFKNVVHSLKNFKSIIKTLAFRHQEHMWYNWQLNLNVVVDPSYGKCSKLRIGTQLCFANLLFERFGITENSEITVTNSIKLLGTVFQKKMFITTERDALDYPMFLEIVELCIFEQPYLICQAWETLTFDTNYQAFMIQIIPNNSQFCIVDLKQLRHVVSYELHQPIDGSKNFIVPKYNIII